MLYQFKRTSKGYGSLKYIPVLAVLILLTGACDNGLMDSREKNSGSDALMSKKGSANCENQVNNNEKKLLECVTLEGVRTHQAALQSISDANGGSRAAFTPGYDASADYIEDALMAAGYTVERQTITNEIYQVNSSAFQQLAPLSIDYVYTSDYREMSFSSSGDVTASVSAVDLDLGPENVSTSGCEASDFAGFPVGDIALIQRGACSFFQKALNATSAGAAGVIIFNQGNTPGREGIIFGTLGSADYGNIPVISTSYGIGVDLATSPGTVVRIQLDAEVVQAGADNILAELPGKNSSNVVMAGAVLDSPGASPGINNNGSGAAAVLETALRMAKVKPQNTVRFAWWADNSTGLQGSFDYVNSLSADELQEIAVYLNFDVIGSPNYVTFVYDGDNSDGVNNPGAPPAPAGSDVIEDLFEEYYSGISEPVKAFDLWTGSASQIFLFIGVPSGGIYSGTFELKTADEVAIWGGVAGEQYDPCAFLACDTFDNVSLNALEFNSDAVAYSILNMAMNTSLINGEKAKGNFKPKSEIAAE